MYIVFEGTDFAISKFNIFILVPLPSITVIPFRSEKDLNIIYESTKKTIDNNILGMDFTFMFSPSIKKIMTNL